MLKYAARHSKWCLLIGLLAGLTWADLAEALRPHLPLMIAGLLFLAAFRIGPDSVRRGSRDSRDTLMLVLLYQLILPLAVLGVLLVFGIVGTTAALAAVLVFSAPSVTGAANFALIMRVPPEAALRLLMVGTALFPITVIPILLLVPALDVWAVLLAAMRLVAVVLLAGSIAFFIRKRFWRVLTTSQEETLDGASAILLGIVVIGLMSAVAPLVRDDPATFFSWLAFAIALNFTAQLLAWRGLKGRAADADHASMSIVAGNRNVALFLVALPASVTDDLLSFIGCYQIPMYLTPVVFRRLYARVGPD